MKKITIVICCCMLIVFDAHSQKSAWGQWHQYPCWPKLWYRLKNNGSSNGKYEWNIQFRNDYSVPVSYSYRLGTEEELMQLKNGTLRTDKRNTLLQPGASTPDDIRAVFQLVASGSSCGVYIDRVHFGNDYASTYAKCGSDKNEEDANTADATAVRKEYSGRLNDIRKKYNAAVDAVNNLQGAAPSKVKELQDRFHRLSGSTSSMLNNSYTNRSLSSENIREIEGNLDEMDNIVMDINTEVDNAKLSGNSAKKTSTDTAQQKTSGNTPVYTETDYTRQMRERADAQRSKDKEEDVAMSAAAAGTAAAMIFAGIKNMDNDDEDDESAMYLKGTIGLGYQNIPVTSNMTYGSAGQSGINNVSQQSSSNHFSINAGLLFAAFNDRLVSFRLSPFFTYGMNAFTSGTSGTHMSYGSGAALGLGRKYKLLLKGEYAGRDGDMTEDQAVNGLDAKGYGSYNYSIIKYGVGAYIGFGGHDAFAEVSAYRESLSFLRNANAAVYSYEAKISFSILAMSAQYAPNYPIAGAVAFPGSYKKEKEDLLILSLYVPFKIFSKL